MSDDFLLVNEEMIQLIAQWESLANSKLSNTEWKDVFSTLSSQGLQAGQRKFVAYVKDKRNV